MSDDPTPKDPKTELEDQLVERAAEPFAKVLDADEQEGMRIVLDLFVKTHPAMQSMVARRVKEDAASKAAKPGLAAPAQAAPAASGVVTKETAPEADDTGHPVAADGSGIVAKRGADEKRAKGKAGGES